MKREPDKKIRATIGLFDPYEPFLLHPSYISHLKKQSFTNVNDEISCNDFCFLMHLIICLGTIYSRGAHKQKSLAKRPVLTHFGDITKLEVDEDNGLGITKGDKVIATLYTKADIAALDTHTLKLIAKKKLKPIWKFDYQLEANKYYTQSSLELFE